MCPIEGVVGTGGPMVGFVNEEVAEVGGATFELTIVNELAGEAEFELTKEEVFVVVVVCIGAEPEGEEEEEVVLDGIIFLR